MSVEKAKKAFEQGTMSAIKGDFEKAINEFSEAIKNDPSNAEYYTNRAMIYAQTKQIKQAIDDSSKAISLDSNNTIAYRTRGMAYASLDQNDEAIKDLDEAIKRDDNDKIAYMCRGTAYMRKISQANNLLLQIGLNQRAKSDFEKVISLNPDPYTLSQAQKMLNITIQNEKMV